MMTTLKRLWWKIVDILNIPLTAIYYLLYGGLRVSGYPLIPIIKFLFGNFKWVKNQFFKKEESEKYEMAKYIFRMTTAILALLVFSITLLPAWVSFGLFSTSTYIFAGTYLLISIAFYQDLTSIIKE
ncbi:hypothetical protein [Pseudomonas amygdali]|uniref:hypothetical protein n=1 Tax=Pseudomonas amygdali TaxID=47877 RepID=UPI001071E902|nr:hypothetical protein [Pseudomonas amygdali]